MKRYSDMETDISRDDLDITPDMDATVMPKPVSPVKQNKPTVEEYLKQIKEHMGNGGSQGVQNNPSAKPNELTVNQYLAQIQAGMKNRR